MIIPICSGGEHCTRSRQSRAAATPMSTTDSSSAAKRRSSMPDISRIHSAVQPRRQARCSLVTTLSGR